jgi:DNA modification methylase
MSYRILIGDCIEQMRTLADQSVNCVVTSPPYFGLRDYGHEGQIGLEATPDAFVSKLVDVFCEVRRVLRDDGTVWLNLGDSYSGSGKGVWNVPDEVKRAAGIKETYRPSSDPCVKVQTGLKPKDLIGIPWRVAFALQADGWYLRQDIIWAKPNPMPESVRDRCTKAHEYIFMLTKSARYWYDAEAIKEESVTGDIRRPYGSQGAWDMDGRPKEQRPNGKPRKTDKQRGHSRRHDGFNDRWDGMTKEEQGALGRNKRSVWTVATKPYTGAHFATFPPALIEPCILAGCPVGGTVLDPFGGSGTTAQVAVEHGRMAILCEINPANVPLINERLSGLQLRLADHQSQPRLFDAPKAEPPKQMTIE